MADYPWTSALVIGASGGLGQALVRNLLKSPGLEKVFATTRPTSNRDPLLEQQRVHGNQLKILDCDTANDEDLRQLAKSLANEALKPDLVIYAAGLLHDSEVKPEKALSQLRRSSMQQVFEANAFSPIMAAHALLPVLDRSKTTHYAALSAMVGSIEDNQLGGWYSYRASKAALNQLLKTLSIECRRTHPQLIVTSIHPGTTDTALSQPFQSNVAPGRLYSPSQSAQRILNVISAQSPDKTGRFLNWNGDEIPW